MGFCQLPAWGLALAAGVGREGNELGATSRMPTVTQVNPGRAGSATNVKHPFRYIALGRMSLLASTCHLNRFGTGAKMSNTFLCTPNWNYKKPKITYKINLAAITMKGRDKSDASRFVLPLQYLATHVPVQLRYNRRRAPDTLQGPSSKEVPTLSPRDLSTALKWHPKCENKENYHLTLTTSHQFHSLAYEPAPPHLPWGSADTAATVAAARQAGLHPPGVALQAAARQNSTKGWVQGHTSSLTLPTSPFIHGICSPARGQGPGVIDYSSFLCHSPFVLPEKKHFLHFKFEKRQNLHLSPVSLIPSSLSSLPFHQKTFTAIIV